MCICMRVSLILFCCCLSMVYIWYIYIFWLVLNFCMIISFLLQTYVLLLLFVYWIWQSSDVLRIWALAFRDDRRINDLQNVKWKKSVHGFLYGDCKVDAVSMFIFKVVFHVLVFPFLCVLFFCVFCFCLPWSWFDSTLGDNWSAIAGPGSSGVLTSLLSLKLRWWWWWWWSISLCWNAIHFIVSSIRLVPVIYHQLPNGSSVLFLEKLDNKID